MMGYGEVVVAPAEAGEAEAAGVCQLASEDQLSRKIRHMIRMCGCIQALQMA